VVIARREEKTLIPARERKKGEEERSDGRADNPPSFSKKTEAIKKGGVRNLQISAATGGRGGK